MKKNINGKVVAVLAVTMLFAGAVTGCGSKEAATSETADAVEENVAVESEALAEEVVSTEGADAVNESQVSESGATLYTDPNGWSVEYDPERFAVNQGENFVSFVYTGESAGSNLVTAYYEVGKNASASINERAEAWGEETTMLDGEFPGASDVIGYWAMLPPAEEGSGLYMTAVARDYLDGALVFELTGHNSGDEMMDMEVADYLAMIIDSLKFVSEE
jgi:hypothetical protein